jgi:hypothetical protein
MAQRLELQEILVGLLGSNEVYFQPAENVNMSKRSIVYNRDHSRTLFADNSPYKTKKRYQVTVIVDDPDSDIPDKVEALPMCIFNRSFVADQLYHFVFNLFF